MPTQQHTFQTRGPFKALYRVEQALKQIELVLESTVKSVTDITSIPNSRRLSLLVEFASGAKVKLVVAAAEHESFEFVKRILDLGPKISAPGVLVVEKGWAAFEWIKGPTLSQVALTDMVLREAVQLLARIHAVKAKEPPDSIMNRVHEKLKDKLPVLVALEIISEKAHDEILELCQSTSRTKFETSLIHGDFSPHNLVVGRVGLVSIDNEKLTDHATDYDLCRAVNLWDEWNSSGESFLEAYRENSPRIVHNERLYFWSVFDLVYRISYRISVGELNDFCVTRLRQMLATGKFR